MKHAMVFASALTVALLASQPASSARYYGFTIGVANAPRPPVIRMLREPRAVLATDAMVYVVDDPSLLPASG